MIRDHWKNCYVKLVIEEPYFKLTYREDTYFAVEMCRLFLYINRFHWSVKQSNNYMAPWNSQPTVILTYVRIFNY